MSKTKSVVENADYFISKLGQNIELKLLGASFFTVLSNFFAGLNTEGIIIAFLLIIADCVTGIIASVKTGDKIRSARLIVTVEKLVIYGIMMLSGFLIDKQLGVSIAESATIFFVGATQFVSILENIGRSGYAIPKKLIKSMKIYTESKEQKNG